MRKQNTIKNTIEFQGIGLHSGHSCQVFIKPAPEDTGIVFLSKSGATNQFIPYNVENVVDTQNNVSVSNGKALIKTVEHLVSSLYAFHIDNCIIECNSNEIPILDGSAQSYVQGIIQTGVVEQTRNKEEFRIINPIWATLDDKFIVALPYNGFKLSYTISFPGSPIGTQTYNTEVTTENFVSQISEARTFGFIEDLEHYKRSGLVLGVNFENVQAYSKKENKILNSSRYHDEPVRHKILDLIGSLALINFDIKGFIIAYKAGHTIDVMFAKKVMNISAGLNKIQSDYYYQRDTSYYYQAANITDNIKMPS